MAVLPPGLNQSQFNTALTRLRQVVGSEWVLSSDEDLVAYQDFWSPAPAPEDRLVPSAAVGPDNVEQLQAIVQIANEFHIPLYPISTGKNFGYGGPAPNVSGSIVVDLKRMDRILEVNDKRNFALVEPGVSYNDLYKHIQDNDLKVWVDTPDPGWGSPVGNTMDRGIGYTMSYYRDHATAMHGLEAVLPNGEIMRTGMGALPGSKTWQEYRYGFGPDPAGLFPQGNYGIVTKMGLRLMPQPRHWRTGMITVPKRRDLGPLIDVVNYLSDLFMIGEPWYGSPMRVLLEDHEFRATATRRGGADEAEMDRWAEKAGLHSWQVELQFYGSEGTTLANWNFARELIMDAVPGARTIDGESLAVPLTSEQIASNGAPYASNMRRNVTQGVPGLGIWKYLGRTEAMPEAWAKGHLGFFFIIPRDADQVFQAQHVFADALADVGIPSTITALTTPNNWNPFCFLFSAGFALVEGNAAGSEEGSERVRETGMQAMLEKAAEYGWAEYRAGPHFQDAVSSHYSWNNYSLRRFNETLKDAIDPNGIIAPGRGGIWPANYRNRG